MTGTNSADSTGKSDSSGQADGPPEQVANISAQEVSSSTQPDNIPDSVDNPPDLASSKNPVNPKTGLEQTSPQARWPQPAKQEYRQVSYSIVVDADAHTLWSLLADPHRHHEVDGSGTVKPRVTGPHQLAVGDQFSVHMRKFKVPYVMKLETTRSEPGVVVEWKHPGGHYWRWEFESLDSGTDDAADSAGSEDAPNEEIGSEDSATTAAPQTLVTETFDYSGVKPAAAKAYELAKVTRDNANGIRSSLTRLAGLYL